VVLRTVLQLCPFSLPSYVRKGGLFAHIPIVLTKSVTKHVHQCKFWLGPPAQKISNVDLVPNVSHMPMALCSYMVLCFICCLAVCEQHTTSFLALHGEIGEVEMVF
jgi:hypothetical protein